MKGRHRIQMLDLLLPAALAIAGAASGEEPRPYVFGWPFVDPASMQPRGGTSRGPEVTLRAAPTAAWEALRAPGLAPAERDRRAILAMAGDWRVSFDFLEVLGFESGFRPAAPYRSWGTERVYVLENRPGFVSLQHLLVMHVIDEDGTCRAPVVVKHWRQDWTLEGESAHVYRGHNTWQRARAPADLGPGYWLQTVWQVDDSPRYAGWGRWVHTPEYSTWQSNETWRPLPRREFAARDDYDVLVGTNRHTILPDGWVQEEENLKVVLDDLGDPVRRLAKEYGIARYEAIEGFDFAAGDRYLQATRALWAEVRAWWDGTLARRDRIHLRAPVDQAGLFHPLFERAERLVAGETPDRDALRAFVRATLRDYLTGTPTGDAGGY